MGTIIGRITEKSTEKSSDKTTCISITAETYKCIDISAFVPQCITITSNVPTSDLYQEQYDRDDVEITDAPILEIILINNEAPVLDVNLDAEGTIYVTDFDVIYIKITNWDANVDYVNLFSNGDGYDAVVYLDEAEEGIVWALDDWAMDGVQMWFYAQAKASDKLISPQANVTVMQMEQTDQPNLSSWVSQTEQTVLNITILDYDATYTYSEPIVTGGTAARTDNVIAWTLPIGVTGYHEISITATAPLMYESLPGVSGGYISSAYATAGITISDNGIETNYRKECYTPLWTNPPVCWADGLQIGAYPFRLSANKSMRVLNGDSPTKIFRITLNDFSPKSLALHAPYEIKLIIQGTQTGNKSQSITKTYTSAEYGDLSLIDIELELSVYAPDDTSTWVWYIGCWIYYTQ